MGTNLTNNYKSLVTTGSFYLVCTLTAIVTGLVASAGSPAYTIIFAGLMVTPLLLSYRTALLLIVLSGGLIFSGLAMLYFPQFQNIRWGVALASILLVAGGILDNLVAQDRHQRGALPGLFWWMIAFILVVIASSIVNWHGVSKLIIGLKSYFQVVGIFFAFVLIAWPDQLIKKLPIYILWTALLQIPFVMHQYFFLVPHRVGAGHGIVPVDIVSGTFGANEFGGGSNAVLSAFMFIIFSVLVALWKRKMLPLHKLMFMSALFLAPIFINQSKVSVLYLALVFMTLYKEELVRRPHRILVPGFFMTLMMLGMIYAYAVINSPEGPKTPAEMIRDTMERNFEQGYSYGSYYLNRGTVITYWVHEHTFRDPLPLLFGHGLRASREGGQGLDTDTTLASVRYAGMGIGLTGVSALLWETGLVGLIMVMGMFGAAFRAAGKLSKLHRNMPFQAAIFDGLQAGTAVMALSLVHKDFFVYDLCYQTVIMILFGYLAYHLRKSSEERAGLQVVQIT